MVVTVLSFKNKAKCDNEFETNHNYKTVGRPRLYPRTHALCGGLGQALHVLFPERERRCSFLNLCKFIMNLACVASNLQYPVEKEYV